VGSGLGHVVLRERCALQKFAVESGRFVSEWEDIGGCYALSMTSELFAIQSV